MAKRTVTYKSCDRCPVGKKPTPATRTIRFGFGETFWDIDVCEKHGADLERDLYGWGRLGRIVEDAQRGRRFGSDYAHSARRLGELRTQQSLEDRAAEVARRDEPEAATGAELLALVKGPRPAAPEDAGDYVFTAHALERLAEREVPVVGALWAASSPAMRRPARQQGLTIHERDGIKVVLNPQTKAIITVAITDRSEEKVKTQ